ncbi:homocysteine methyltransferase [Vibrio breoganii]|nr:homocysteine methyltransferase [Vibrio breoganii]
MVNHRRHLIADMTIPTLCYTGIDTELLFTHNQPLPGYASYPLLAKSSTRAIIEKMYIDLIALAKRYQTAVILDAMTWIASSQRGAMIGLNEHQLRDFNLDAIDLMAQVRDRCGDLPTLLSAQIGPREDGYQANNQMSANESLGYHSTQIDTYKLTKADFITASTLSYPEEAAGIVLAAKSANIPVVVSFTVELDGNLPNGESLEDAIAKVDGLTKRYASYFMINCAHPSHFSHSFTQQPWEQRIKGIVVNASKCSHAELDRCETLDSGDPFTLGKEVAEICRQNTQISVVGGCCGTNLDHLEQIMKNLRES